MSFPMTVSRHSSKSLKAESAQVEGGKTSEKGDYTGMATISNTKLDGDSIGHLYD